MAGCASALGEVPQVGAPGNAGRGRYPASGGRCRAILDYLKSRRLAGRECVPIRILTALADRQPPRRSPAPYAFPQGHSYFGQYIQSAAAKGTPQGSMLLAPFESACVDAGQTRMNSSMEAAIDWLLYAGIERANVGVSRYCRADSGAQHICIAFARRLLAPITSGLPGYTRPKEGPPYRGFWESTAGCKRYVCREREMPPSMNCLLLVTLQNSR